MTNRLIPPFLSIMLIYAAASCLGLCGCISISLPPDEGVSWKNSLVGNIGSSYSGWAKEYMVQEELSLPVLYPTNWTSEQWCSKYLKYAKRFHGYRDTNYLYERDIGANWERGTGKWILRTGKPPSYEEWVSDICTRRVFQGNIGESKARALLESGKLQAHFIPIRRGRDPIVYNVDYLVVFTIANTIMGYGESSYGNNELGYINEEFGFVP
mgnify:CR=1 FL=1